MDADYLFPKDKFYDTRYDTGDKVIQCGRHNDIFKLWLQWRAKVRASLIQNTSVDAMMVSSGNSPFLICISCCLVISSPYSCHPGQLVDNKEFSGFFLNKIISRRKISKKRSVF